jgi:hypothetical protein
MSSGPRVAEAVSRRPDGSLSQNRRTLRGAAVLHKENHWQGQWFKKAAGSEDEKTPFNKGHGVPERCGQQREAIQMELYDINRLSHTNQEL